MNNNTLEVDKIISAWTARVLGDPRLAECLGGVFKLTIEGGQSWIFDCRGIAHVRQEDGSAECTVSMSADDLVAIATGTLNPQVAFLQGRLKVKGNPNLALRLEALFCGGL